MPSDTEQMRKDLDEVRAALRVITDSMLPLLTTIANSTSLIASTIKNIEDKMPETNAQ